MPVPKTKSSRSRRDKRRANWKLTVPGLVECPQCHAMKKPHHVCPVCGSHNLTKIDRMNGYLSYSRVHGDTRLNEAKMAEIAERKSM